LVEPVLRDSLGVVTHSAYAADRVRDLTVGRTSVAPLPVLGPSASARRPGTSSGELRLVVAGALNANKCVDRLLEAIASHEALAAVATVRVVGPAGNAARDAVLALADRLGLAERVVVTGALPRDAYDAELAAASVLVCLRDPVLEAASASLLEGMATGGAAVVLDTGHYAELPDDAVVKVDPTGGPAALAAALSTLRPAATRAALGARAADHAARHTPSAYAQVLRAAGTHAATLRPTVHALAGTRALLRRAGLDRHPTACRAAATALARLGGAVAG
jgi:glycosyltransferase involved in cell wall biosynthesis